MIRHYTQVRARREKPMRLVVLVPRQEIEAVDQWAIGAELPNRTVAVRHLLQKGLEAVERGI